MTVVGNVHGVVTIYDASDGRLVSRTPGLDLPSDAAEGFDGGGVVFGEDGLVYVGSRAARSG